MFLKTHKCGSSTVQNILLRFAYSNNLTLALPEELNYLGDPASKFRADLLPPRLVPPGGKVDVFALHARLDVRESLKVLHQDALWITIVRNPVDVFESLYAYYDLREIYRLDVNDFKFMPMSVNDSLLKLPRASDLLGKNQMLFDLGFPDDLPEARLRQAIEGTDRLFDLVMVAERMDESLVLLRHLLCWSLHDVVVFAKNARRKGVRPALDAHTRRTLRELNGADARLYEHFLAKHRRAVIDFGVRRMAREVAALRGLRARYFRECNVVEVKGDEPFFQFREYSGLVSSYVTAETANQTCLLLCLPETPLVDLVRERQLRVGGP
ncbi:galactose-3-O-sulfotransferase 3-like [Penaeus monodon]|uniref:galactose-3-O-sulfotransferase 3-like n=1 Tax=Penaeus monodon TaxID=6687 RepID=UPI0018A7D824|nr:galactose-3-O-sulfotransferase 3-like [Penaeus monodon]